MNITSCFLRKFKVNHCLQPLDIKPTRSQISCHEILILSFFEVAEGLNTNILAEISMEFADFEFKESENDRHSMALLLCFEEDDCPFFVVFSSNCEKSCFSLIFFSYFEHLLSELIVCDAIRISLNPKKTRHSIRNRTFLTIIKCDWLLTWLVFWVQDQWAY